MEIRKLQGDIIMNYQLHYDRLVIRAKLLQRKKYKRSDERYVYYERHHIIPECFFITRRRKGPAGWLAGNPDAKENIALLTPDEHYLAHQLLAKMYPNNHAMIKAANMMCTASNDGNQPRNNKRFGWLRRKLGEVFSEEKLGKESPLKGRSSPLKGKIGATKGQPSPKKGIKTGPNGQKGVKKGPSPFKGVPSGRKGIPSEKKGIPSGKKGSIRGPNLKSSDQVICPHCGRKGAVAQMKRWHFNNCKIKKLYEN